MSRDDSILYTGATSASFTSPRSTELAEKRKISRDKRIERGQQLRPSAKVVNDIIDREKAKVTQELANMPLNVTTTNENVKELLMAYQRNLVFIEHVRTQINIALKEID